MALPTLSKTWQFNVNQTVYHATSNYRNNLVSMADVGSLVGFASNPWVVWGSSDGSTYGNGDGVYRWSMSMGGYPWVVLTNPVTGMQLLYFMANSGYHNQDVRISVSFGGLYGVAGGGTNGVANTPPTAPDSQQLNGSNLYWASQYDRTQKVHVMHSTDGTQSRIVHCSANAPYAVALIGEASPKIAGWSGMFAAAHCTDNADQSKVTLTDFCDNARMYSRMAGGNFASYITCEGQGTATLAASLTYPDDDTGEWPLLPMGLASRSGVHRGRKGAVPDLWWGSVSAGTGSTYPADASRQFAQLGHMVFPWNGSAVEIG